MLSGYCVLARRLVKSFPVLSAGFEIETELTVHALQLRVPIAEIATPYKGRPLGSQSKLRTVQDGVRILSTIVRLVKEEGPFYFFSIVGLAFRIASLLSGFPVAVEYMRTASADGGLLGFLALCAG
jgi:hypothetical protein